MRLTWPNLTLVMQKMPKGPSIPVTAAPEESIGARIRHLRLVGADRMGDLERGKHEATECMENNVEASNARALRFEPLVRGPALGAEGD
jgi:hypothetical protein